MIPHAPSDATFASLMVGLCLGLSFAVGSYVSLTQSWPHQLDRLLALLQAHSILTWTALAALATACAKIGWFRATGEATLKAEERLSALKRNIAHLPAHFPNGWYKLCDSDEIAIGTSKHVQLLNKDVALFRAAGDHKTGAGRGEVHVLDAICPHLGANLGQNGKVDGNNLECPFHGWQFSKEGTCTKIPYAAKIPPTAKTGVWQACEVNGAVFLWYDVDFRQPTWTIPSHGPRLGHTLHGRLTRDVPGNIQELVTKHADSWSGDLTPSANPQQQQASASSSASVFGFAWEWSRDKCEWVTSKESPSEAVLHTSAHLTFLGVRVPLGQFAFRVEHAGPSMVYVHASARSTLVKCLTGHITLATTFRPHSPFVNTAEFTARTRTEDAGVLARLVDALALPVRRATAKLALCLLERRFVATVLPVYTPRKLNLSLHNSGGARDAFAKSAPEEEEEEPQPEADSIASCSSPGSRSSCAVTSRSVAPSSPLPPAEAPPSFTRSKLRSVNKGYTSTSAFFATFWRSFYSASGNKKQDDLTW